MLVPPRTKGQQRRYAEQDVSRLNFIRHVRELGFEIEDIRELLALTAQPQASCQKADSIALRHLDAVGRRIAQLAALRAELQRMIDECGRGRACDCLIIDTFSRPV